MTDLFNNIVANLIVGILGWVSHAVFNRWLWPFVRSRTHSTPKIGDTVWDGYSQEPASGAQPDGKMTVKQWGDVITATVERSTASGTREFHYRGKIRDHQIVLTWDEPLGGGSIFGSMVMSLSANRRRLEGLTVYKRLDSGTVVSVPRIYVRRQNN